jgi:hypothetical protein
MVQLPTRQWSDSLSVSNGSYVSITCTVRQRLAIRKGLAGRTLAGKEGAGGSQSLIPLTWMMALGVRFSCAFLTFSLLLLPFCLLLVLPWHLTPPVAPVPRKGAAAPADAFAAAPWEAVLPSLLPRLHIPHCC